MLGIDWVEIQEYERGLVYEKGKFVSVVGAGRHWTWPGSARRIDRVDMRETSQSVEGQEILTSDKIGVRVTLVAQYRPEDPVLARHRVENYVTQLYQDLQLSLREIISSRTLEALLANREALSGELLQIVSPRAAGYGVLLSRVGVKDFVLPAQVRAVFLQEVEADLKGRANLVAARHETAAARSRANTARVLAETPGILRLQELETLAALAAKPGNMLLLPGLDLFFQRGTAALK